MGHIQQGDIRQYFSQHQPDIDYSGQYANMLNSGLQTGVSITQKANESTMASNQIDLSTKFLAENNKINTKYQSDPTNPQREVELRQAFDSLANQYKINPACEKQWSDIKTNVFDRYKVYNSQWVEKQQQQNIQLNLKNGYENLTNQISMLGLNGADIDQMKLIYANGIEGLRNGAVAGLGEVYVDNFLKDSNHDIMTSYISALALNNPLEAQALLKREDVRNDIGRAETLQKLDDYVANSLKNQSKRTAVNELGNTLRGMNSEQADMIINGKADLNQVMKFIENNKNLPEGSKDLILDIYGIGSTSEYIYDKDKKRILKKEDAGSGSSKSKTSIAKMPDYMKKTIAETLEQDLHNLLSFSEENQGNLNVKDIKNAKNQKEAGDFLIRYMNNVAQMQGQIDAAYSAGVISKDDRKRMMNDYITPVADYLESNLNQLDESSIIGIAGKKLGYDQIAKAFSTDGLKNKKDILETNRQKLFAQNYYLDELNKVVAKVPNLNSVYDIESLPSQQQKEIYKTASNNALLRAKRWTDKPEYFFAKEFPTVYSQPFTYFRKEEAGVVNRIVAEAVYKREFENPDGTSKLNLQDFANNKMITEIHNQAKKNRIKAGGTLDLRNTEMSISNPAPKNINEFYKRVKALGITPEEFMQQAEKRGFTQLPNMSIGQRWNYAHKKVTGQIDPMAGYYYALQQAEQAKALQDKNKRK